MENLHVKNKLTPVDPVVGNFAYEKMKVYIFINSEMLSI